MGEVLGIVRVRVDVRSFDPVRAEVWVAVTAGPESSRGRVVLELQGNLRGPRCRYSQTVEVAYPLRKVPTDNPCELVARVVIPEPCPWDVQSPFLYGGRVQLLADGHPGDSCQVGFGLRDLRIGPSGVRCNGRPVELRGETLRDGVAEVPWGELRRRGVNLLLVPAAEGSVGRWAAADETGCLVIYELAAGEFAERLAAELSQHPCGLGLLVPAERMSEVNAGPLPLGVELREPPRGPLPPGVRFVVGPADELSALGDLPVLKLVRDAATGTIRATAG
jgi:hypothetical protein